MSAATVLYIILSGIIALVIALFQYVYKSKRSRLNLIFTGLRFVTFFSIFLLLVNPKFEQITNSVEKPNLVIAADNSSSVLYLEQNQKEQELIRAIKNDEAINEKFNVNFYTFGNNLQPKDSLSFTDEQTNISKAISELSQIYKNSIAPMILITDGNQTYGNDYEFTSSSYKQPIFPVILGDTTTYVDLQIKQLNVNRYAYLKNRFPVEAIVTYNGNENITTDFTVSYGNTIVYSEKISFSRTNTSSIINFALPTNTAGVHTYKATISTINNEKNKVNNNKNFAVEVIDQKTNIAMVSSFLHPDLGALKQSIESNEQRSVTFLKPNEVKDKLDDFQLVILYQPNRSFNNLYEVLKAQNKNTFVITGSQTDWRFLNSINSNYEHEITNQTENYLPELNNNYSTFILDDLDFESFPPLKSTFGKVTFNTPVEILLYKKVGNVSTKDPLLLTFESNNRREALLLGENLWQWRSQSFLNTQSFNQFDNFLGKLIQYLSSNKRKSRLKVEYESFYNGSSSVIINAQYFNKNYEFDARETLTITLRNKATQNILEYPFVLKNNSYQLDLSSLSPAEYEFTVRAKNENISKSGIFKILEYNIEQQFLNANVKKLNQVAINSTGKSYFIDNYSNLSVGLLNDERFLAVQKNHKNIIPLIDWKYLLFLLVFCLATEWFLRKYNGLI
ncbi:VWA domain-containing protein [Yeosuana sp. MJ-SS3]|uniref:VWA domain-containing protein n=1 Tax=Gilvirhabdus luticola TaxID=3079858 RepID=A0ABU3U9X1_9FLAO|nr:VWA domain-containing protein [Yeosuana sp. MJ-SS3]MDU8887111.1 VWA domain-containing protein [Yeosuana sp. MJ-SS3]